MSALQTQIQTQTPTPEQTQDQAQRQTAPARQIMVYTTTWCGDCRRAKRVFATAGVPSVEVDITQDPEAAERARRWNGGMYSVPTIVFPDGSRLVEPSSSTLAAKLATVGPASER
jgi:mycoredoxin